MIGQRALGWRVRRGVGTLLMAGGVLTLAATAGLYASGEYARVQFERQQAMSDAAEATATAAAVGRPESAATVASADVPPPAAPTREPAPSAVPTAPAAGPAPAPVPASRTLPAPPGPPPVALRRVVAPSIGLDAPVVESKVVDGEWVVPKFVAGHLEGTALPGSGSNVVLSGHVQSLTSGNVFADIDKLKPGDLVTLRTSGGDVAYRIEGKNIVKNDDLSVVQATPREELTLITCTGTFNPLTRDYDKRWVVWGVRADQPR